MFCFQHFLPTFVELLGVDDLICLYARLFVATMRSSLVMDDFRMRDINDPFSELANPKGQVSVLAVGWSIEGVKAPKVTPKCRRHR